LTTSTQIVQIVPLDPKDHRAFKVLKETLVLKEILVLKVFRVYKENRVPMVQTAPRDHRVLKEILDHRDHRENLGTLPVLKYMEDVGTLLTILFSLIMSHLWFLE